jgi:hypothetical protein
MMLMTLKSEIDGLVFLSCVTSSLSVFKIDECILYDRIFHVFFIDFMDILPLPFYQETEYMIHYEIMLLLNTGYQMKAT